MTTYYCDSVSGDDGNDGLAPETAKQTLAAVVALETSGQHSCVIAGDCSVSALDIGSVEWIFESDSSATIDVAGSLYNSAKSYQRFRGVTFSGDTVGFLNGNHCTFVDCDFLDIRAFDTYQYVFADSCRFGAGGSVSAIYGHFSGCEFRDTVSGGNAGYANFNACRFLGDGTKLFATATATTLSHCSFYNFASVYTTNRRVFRAVNCVFDGGDADRGSQLPREYFSATATAEGIVGCWGWNGTHRFPTGFVDYSPLSGPAYADPANGDWTPSEELAAIVGSDGRTPGAVQAAGGGGNVSAALRRGNRLAQRGVRL